jgi:hypothetical protein
MILFLLMMAADPVGGDDWKYELVHRVGQSTLRGLVLEQTPKHVRIRCVQRRPGRWTLFYTISVPKEDVRLVELLPEEDRKKLEARLDALKRERETLYALEEAIGKGTATPADVVELSKADWPGGGKALAYESTHFKLVAAGRPELAQLAAVYLDQVYEAYARFLPPRLPRGERTTIYLPASIADYQAFVKGRGLSLLNPAYYDSGRNEVVCGSDLSRLCDERDRVRAHHAKLRGQIREKRGELTKAYKGKPPASLLAPLADAEKRMAQSEEKNSSIISRARERLFQRLYHEAFHAYLGAFVYDGKKAQVPIWLNEGLAQVFETALVEAGELRVGHAERTRLLAVQQALEKKSLLSLEALLKSGADDFQIAHDSNKDGSARAYLAAWALAHYLTFEKRLLGSTALDEYATAMAREANPSSAFRTLMGKPLDEVEADWHAYLRKLRPDGSAGK